MSKALLIVASPLQLMNARAAMQYFQVEEYKLLILKDNSSERHNQIIIMAQHYQMKFNLIDYINDVYINKRMFLRNFILSFGNNEVGNYDIIIHGDYRNVYPLISFYKQLKRNGQICFVDDGNATINVFKGKDIAIKEKFFYSLLKLSLKRSGITSFQYFTIYDDIQTKSFSVIPNKLLEIGARNTSDETIYILGTNTILHAEYNATSLELFLNRIYSALKDIKLKHPTQRIILIPHGREQSQKILFICDKLGIEYLKLDECVESYFAKQANYPEVVYAFGSSALFNLKIMFPKTECINLYIKGNIEKHNQIYNEINAYYHKHGITLNNLINDSEIIKQ